MDAAAAGKEWQPPDWAAGLRRVQAAAYCGMSPGHFDKLVRESIMPPGREASGVRIWLRSELDLALADLPVTGGAAQSSVEALFECRSG